MFNAHFQFSLFLWYDNNVKQRYCYGCCAEIGSFMPQTVSFPEKTIVVKKIWSIWVITFKVRTFPWQSPRLSKYQFIFNLTIKYWILVYLRITFWSSLISFCIIIPQSNLTFFSFCRSRSASTYSKLSSFEVCLMTRLVNWRQVCAKFCSFLCNSITVHENLILLIEITDSQIKSIDVLWLSNQSVQIYS